MAKHLCRTWRPISISKADKITPPTVREIAETNAAQEVWCPVPKSGPPSVADETRARRRTG